MLDELARADPSAPSAGQSRSLRMLARPALVATVAAALLLLYLLLRNGSWVYDDNLFLAEFHKSGLTWDWLTRPIFQHWGIAYQFVYAAIAKLMPLDYRWILIVMLVTLGAAAMLLARSVNLLFGWRWRAVMVGIYFALSIFFVRNLQWTASGLQAIPNAFFDLLCLYGYVRLQIEGSRRWAALSAGALAGGLLFYERPAYMLLYLALIRILLLTPRLRPRPIVLGFWNERLLWALLLLITAIWAVSFHVSGGGQGLTGGTVSLSQYLQFFRILWVQTLVPGLAGFVIPASSLTAGQVAGAVGLQCVVLVALVVSVRRASSAWRAWVFLGITVVVSGAIVARARIPVFGPGVAADVRYLTDFAWLVPLAIGFAFHPRAAVLPGSPGSPVAPGSERPGAVRSRRPARALAVGVSLLLIGYAVVVANTATGLQDHWAGHLARGWEANFHRSLDSLPRFGRKPVLADGPAPYFMVESAFAPYDRLGPIAPLYGRAVQIDGPVEGPLTSLDSSGVAVHVKAVTLSGGEPLRSLLRRRLAVISSGVQIVDRPPFTCLSTGTGSATITRRLSRPLQPARTPLYLRLTYTTRSPEILPVLVDSGHGYPLASDRLLRMSPQARESILYLATETPRQLTLQVLPDQTFCIERLDVVALQPAG